jgi:PAS domain S-box-containing protein
MFGYTAAEAIGVDPDDHPRRSPGRGRTRCWPGFVRASGDALRDDSPAQGRTRIPISLTVSPIYDDAGVVIGASKIARDITERHV